MNCKQYAVGSPDPYQVVQLAQNAQNAWGSGNTGNTSTGSTGNRNGNSIWNKVIDNAGGWINSVFGGVTSAIQAKTGNYPTVQEDNTPKVLAISAVAAVVLIVIVLLITK